MRLMRVPDAESAVLFGKENFFAKLRNFPVPIEYGYNIDKLYGMRPFVIICR